MNPALVQASNRISGAVERRLFCEYGAVFITQATPPPVVIFEDANAVNRFQLTLETRSAVIGEHSISLQAPAIDALLRAARDANDEGLQVAARSADSGARSYDDTVNLWLRNVNRGLDHWTGEHKLDPAVGDRIRRSAPIDQVALVLGLEQTERLYFGTYFDKSILYSVAAPGASQHLSLLAFDVRDYESRRIESILNDNGWFRTVTGDLPHFTYLGLNETELPEAGLNQVSRTYGEREYDFWLPDVERLF